MQEIISAEINAQVMRTILHFTPIENLPSCSGRSDIFRGRQSALIDYLNSQLGSMNSGRDYSTQGLTLVQNRCGPNPFRVSARIRSLVFGRASYKDHKNFSPRHINR